MSRHLRQPCGARAPVWSSPASPHGFDASEGGEQQQCEVARLEGGAGVSGAHDDRVRADTSDLADLDRLLVTVEQRHGRRRPPRLCGVELRPRREAVDGGVEQV